MSFGDEIRPDPATARTAWSAVAQRDTLCFTIKMKVFVSVYTGPLVNQLPVSGFFGLWCLVVGLFFISKALLRGFCRGPLLVHRAPPVIAGRRGCPCSPTRLSPALPLVGTAAGGVTCCVAKAL